VAAAASSGVLVLATRRQARNSRNSVTKKCWKHDLTARASKVAEPNAIAEEDVEPAVMTALLELRLCVEEVSAPAAVTDDDDAVGEEDEESGDDGDENDCVDEC
jgi:hypothetical protein